MSPGTILATYIKSEVTRLDGTMLIWWFFGEIPALRMILHLDPGKETKIQATCLDPLTYKEVEEFEP